MITGFEDSSRMIIFYVGPSFFVLLDLHKVRLLKETLLMAQWVEMEVLEIKITCLEHAFFDSMGAVRQISSPKSVSNRVVTQRHALSA